MNHLFLAPALDGSDWSSTRPVTLSPWKERTVDKQETGCVSELAWNIWRNFFCPHRQWNHGSSVVHTVG